MVYVDSASTDGSTDLARSLGVEVVNLDMSIYFSVARARNEGFERLLKIAPNVKYVQFIDGDCEMLPGFVDAARQTLDERDDVALVTGRRRERYPERSTFNAMADIEWNTPLGETKTSIGDCMIRVSAFKQVGGFDGTVAAGESNT